MFFPCLSGFYGTIVYGGVPSGILWYSSDHSLCDND